jgi:hypothetical protein
MIVKVMCEARVITTTMTITVTVTKRITVIVKVERSIAMRRTLTVSTNLSLCITIMTITITTTKAISIEYKVLRTLDPHCWIPPSPSAVTARSHRTEKVRQVRTRKNLGTFLEECFNLIWNNKINNKE